MAKLHFPHALTLSAITLAAASLGACSAQGYGHGSSFAGANCVPTAQACGGRYGDMSFNGGEYATAAHKTRKSRYGSETVSYGYEQFVPQQMMLRPAPQQFAQQSFGYETANTSFQAPVYQEPTYSVETFSQTTTTPANCPIGTTAQNDGTCLQGSSISSYSAPTYSAPSYSSSTSTTAPALGEYDWGTSHSTWGSDDYVSPGTLSVDAPNGYPSTPAPRHSYKPVSK